MGKKRKTNKTVELEEHGIFLMLPSQAVEVELTAKVYVDGDIVKCTKSLDMSEIRDGFEEFDYAEGEGYISPYATFRLTDKALAEMENGIEEVED